MKIALKWIGDALSSKDIVSGKSFYKVAASEIRATDGRLIAGHPWPDDTEFVVPGEEFEAVFKRMKQEPTIKKTDKGIAIRSGLFHGSINTLSLDKWAYPGVEDAVWQSIPGDLMMVLKQLRPFVSDNAMQKWATCVALENSWAYATNNVALAGAYCTGLDCMALLPVWAVDFVLARTEGLTRWAWASNYVAFQWDNGAWMRASLVVGQFPERAAAMIREAVKEKTTQKIDDDYRQAFVDVAEMAEDTIMIYQDRIVAKFKQAEVIANIQNKVPPEVECSIWGASFLLPAIMIADSWAPDSWPKPAPFKGRIVSGYVVGRRA
jgi:hypothetical protein